MIKEWKEITTNPTPDAKKEYEQESVKEKQHPLITVAPSASGRGDSWCCSSSGNDHTRAGWRGIWHVGGYARSTNDGRQPRDLFPRGNKSIRKSFVLVLEVLDFGLKLCEPCLLALPALERGCQGR